MKRMIVFFFLIWVLSVYGMWDMRYMTSNQVGIAITNFGTIGQDTRTIDSGTYWPIDYSNETYIYGAGIWIGGIVDTTGGIDTLVTVGFNEDVISHEFVPGITDAVMEDETTKIHFKGLFEDKGAYYSVCWFNDMDPTYHSVPENLPLDVSVRLNTYQPILPIVENAVFFEYTIVNNSDGPISNMYIGLNMDNDIGDERVGNDLVGFIPKEDVAYQFQTTEETGWVHFPGIIAAGIIESPFSDRDVIIPYPDGSEDTINVGEELGLTSFKNYGIDTDPTNKIERYLLMAGYDDGSYSPWSSLPSVSDGVYEEDLADGGDKRFILSCGPFNLERGDSVKIVYAIYFQNYDTLRWDPVIKNMKINKMYWEHPNLQLVWSPQEDDVIDTVLKVGIFPYFSPDSMAVLMVDTTNGEVYSVYRGEYSSRKELNVSDVPDGYYEVYIVSYSDTMYAYNGVSVVKNSSSLFIENNPSEKEGMYIIKSDDEVLIGGHNGEVVIIDMLGRIIFSSKKRGIIKWNTEKLKNGIYFIIDKEGGEVHKIEIFK